MSDKNLGDRVSFKNIIFIFTGVTELFFFFISGFKGKNKAVLNFFSELSAISKNYEL